MKTNNIPLKSLLKVQLEMQKKFKIFFKGAVHKVRQHFLGGEGYLEC